jgi:hypothetical protein
MLCRLRNSASDLRSRVDHWIPEQQYEWPTSTTILFNPRAQP